MYAMRQEINELLQMDDRFIEIFEHNGNFIQISQDKYEPREIFIERVNYILNELKDNILDDDLIVRSRKWSNQKNLGCSY